MIFERGLAPFRVNPHFVVTSVVHHEWLTMNGTRMNPFSLTHSLFSWDGSKGQVFPAGYAMKAATPKRGHDPSFINPPLQTEILTLKTYVSVWRGGRG